MAKNPLIRSYPRKVAKPQPQKSAGILDDHAVRKNIATKEGTIEKVPVNDSDIANKKYVDDTHVPAGNEGEIQFNESSQFQADSNLFWDNVNKRLGIGTNTPSEELEVIGTIKANALQATDLTAGSVVFSDGTNLTEDNGNLFWDDANNRLGVGTNSPDEVLHLYEATDGVSNLIKIHNPNNSIASEARMRYECGGNIATFELFSPLHAVSPNRFKIKSSNYIDFWTSGTNRMSVNNIGVGIGTESPDRQFHVTDTTDLIVKFETTKNNGTVALWFGDAGRDDIGRITYDHSDNSMNFRVNDAEKMTIESDGDIGIGETAPNSKLEINGSLSLPIVAKTANYTLDATDYTVLLDGTSNTVTATLPTASGIDGRIYNIKCIDDTNQCDVDPNGAEEIDGDSTTFILSKDDVITIQSDGSNWWII